MSETVIRGRFAPPTTEAVSAVRQALQSGPVRIDVTCAELARSSRLPWTVAERIEMLRLALGEDADRATISASDGREGETLMHQSAVVAAFLEGQDVTVPPPVSAWLEDFRGKDVFAQMSKEAQYINDYKRAWAAAPYDVILVTVDTVIVHADAAGAPHILLIRRGGIPGKDTYAVPGGFVEAGEYLLASALRELREETGLSLSDAEALSRLKGQHVFDDPERSSRGRIITHAFYFEFPPGTLPDVEGLDDAVEARWVKVSDLPDYKGQFFEDHGAIVRHFLG